jgi:hypothetical protein
MHSHKHHRGLVLVSTLIAAVAALLVGAPPASAATWRDCEGTPYYVYVKVKGVSCAQALRIEKAAIDKIPGGLPVNWSGRVGQWKCTYVNNQGPGSMACSNGARKFRIDTAA